MELRNLKLVLMLLAGTAAALTGCGGGDSSPDSFPTGGSGQAPPPPPPPTASDPFPVSDVFNMGSNNRILDPGLNVNGTPSDLSPDIQGATFAFDASSPDLQDPAFELPATLGADFQIVDYIGAFAQDTPDNWTEGWTVSLNGNTTIWEPATGGTLAGATPLADDTCPANTTDVGNQNLPAVFNGAMDLCQLERRYETDGTTITLTNDNIYLLASGFPGTYIGNGEAADGDSTNDVSVTLVVEPGTLILGSPQEALIITRGSEIQAIGTAEDPIVLTSRDQFEDWQGGSDGESGRGEWAGLALMGYGQSNECGSPCDVAAEGNIGAYGGTDDTDSSGRLEYVVIRHAGNDLDGNGNELNGLTMFATGSGTRASYIQVHKGLDDGVEHFGATDFMDHIVITDCRDDSFDWGQGYRGGAQFVVIRQARDDADRGIEADNDGDAPLAVPVSKPTLANFTIIGRPDGDPTSDGVLLRRGTGADIYNFVITGFLDACLDVDDDATADLFGTDLTINNTVLFCDGGVEIEDDGDVAGADIQAWFATDAENQVVNANLKNDGTPNPVEGAGNNFVSTNYIGAFAQDTEDNWTEGWTVSLNGNDTVWEPATGGTLAGAPPLADGTCPAGTTDIGDEALPGAFGSDMDLCQLERRYDTDGQTITLTNDNIYATASGFPGTYIGNGEAADGDSTNDVSVTLVIEPGTLILGSPQEAVTITRGSRIEAIGTAEDPIVFSSRAQFDNWVQNNDGTSGRGDWAGVALMGYAQSNECGDPCDVNAEGNIGAYGGTDDADSSGTLEYVVIRHAGNDIDGNGNELNGLTFFATGSGTRASFVQVHKGLDDGVEHFGSTDFIDHIVLTDNRDDSFDWGQGYRGGAQFVVIRQGVDDADRGIEADNDGDAPLATPISQPTLANFTMIGTGGAVDDDTIGILLRRGTGALISNSVITGFDVCFDLDNDATFDQFTNGNITLENTVLSCVVNFDEE